MNFTRIEGELSANHGVEQISRFLRLFFFAFAPQLIAISGHLGRSAILAAVVASAETAFRQLYPAWTARNLRKAAEADIPAPPEPPVVK